ncbi:hypothetical protein Shyd_86810 [Streptomyces hydrogenans]|uniref:Uncharacterized protein n=1 Tax=Streptomyces hydrogenans TaxID=1873719 RepID=A0ABQ3PQL0_9ACTN|nr:hypothetical protein GCM10018784_42970 [Streptomyces hydrogenans]GHI27310.1 hypothetical protein Shyd_86810 [Streptomyces hydrogenans]
MAQASRSVGNAPGERATAEACAGLGCGGCGERLCCLRGCLQASPGLAVVRNPGVACSSVQAEKSEKGDGENIEMEVLPILEAQRNQQDRRHC